jgi:hypothetical protein
MTGSGMVASWAQERLVRPLPVCARAETVEVVFGFVQTVERLLELLFHPSSSITASHSVKLPGSSLDRPSCAV